MSSPPSNKGPPHTHLTRKIILPHSGAILRLLVKLCPETLTLSPKPLNLKPQIPKASKPFPRLLDVESESCCILVVNSLQLPAAFLFTVSGGIDGRIQISGLASLAPSI